MFYFYLLSVFAKQDQIIHKLGSSQQNMCGSSIAGFLTVTLLNSLSVIQHKYHLWRFGPSASAGRFYDVNLKIIVVWVALHR